MFQGGFSQRLFRAIRKFYGLLHNDVDTVVELVLQFPFFFGSVFLFMVCFCLIVWAPGGG